MPICRYAKRVNHGVYGQANQLGYKIRKPDICPRYITLIGQGWVQAENSGAVLVAQQIPHSIHDVRSYEVILLTQNSCWNLT
jgi:hypothetical protein